jgi:single-strand DNA-binding protein
MRNIKRKYTDNLRIAGANGYIFTLENKLFTRPAAFMRRSRSFKKPKIMLTALKNNVQLIGRLGKEVELKDLENGNKVANVSLATNDYYTNAKGDKVEETQWHNLVAWGKTADWMQQLLTKGSEVLIQGKLVHRDYETKNGEKKYVTEVVVRDFMKLGRKES